MAVAAFSRSTGVAGLIFTLLCLVSFASSQVKQENLELLRERLHELQRKSDEMKANFTFQIGTHQELMRAELHHVDTKMEILKRGPPELQPQLDVLEIRKAHLELVKYWMDMRAAAITEQIKENEENLRKALDQIVYLEYLKGSQAEL